MGWNNDIDRYAGELDTTGYMVAVGTHGEYYRASPMSDALRQLAGRSAPGPTARAGNADRGRMPQRHGCRGIRPLVGDLYRPR